MSTDARSSQGSLLTRWRALGPGEDRPILPAFSRWRGHGALVLLVVLCVCGLAFVNNFASTDNLVRIVQSQALVGIVAVGMTFIVLSGNFVDLSVPAIMAVAANAVLLIVGTSVPLALAAALGLGLLIGLVNGLLVGRLEMNPVIATLGVRTVVGGLLFLVTTGDTSIGDNPGFHDFGRSRPLGIPIAAIAFVGILLAAQLVLSRSTFGAQLRFAGSNREAARANGMPDRAVTTACFVIAALLTAIAGFLLAAFSNTGELVTGAGYEFDALAAVVIGGTSLHGGIGSMWRTLVGVLVIGVASNMMLLLGLDSSAQLLVKGLIFILAVTLDALASRKES